MITLPPIPSNEMERLLSLSALDLDYTGLENTLKDLTRVAAGIAGTDISLVNLIDTYTQWSVARYGFPLEQMPREDSVCQYTILEGQHFEVPNLSADERFKNKDYVIGEPGLRYYFGVPLTSEDGQNIGALCVMDKTVKVLDPKQVELLKFVAKEIMVRLKSKQVIELLKRRLTDITATQNKLAHDLRGPVSGIVGIARLFKRRVYESNIEKVAEVFDMIENSGQSVLVLAEEILSNKKKMETRARPGKNHQYNLPAFKEAIEKLCLPMAKYKDLHFEVKAVPENENVFFAKDKLVQITSNLISNAIKFTSAGGTVSVALTIELNETANILRICVQDSGVGISAQAIRDLAAGNASSTNGTVGEGGYGLGLSLVNHLVDSLSGSMQVYSQLGEGTRFEIQLPQKQDPYQTALSEPAFTRMAL